MSNMFASCHTEAKVHNTLMTSLCCDYLDEDSCKDRFRKFKSHCRLYLTTPREKSLSTAQDIWDCLESKGKLGVGSYETLKELTSDIDNDITELIQAAENKIDELEGRRSSKRRKTESPDCKIDHLKETLLNINNSIVMDNQISPLQKRGKRISVDQLYVPVTIKEDTGYNYNPKYCSTEEIEEETKSKSISKLKEMFYKNDNPVRYIFMHGEAARGKSMYCKQLLNYWCNANQIGKCREELSEHEKTLSEFDFTFLVSLRQVHQSRTLLEDMICYDTFKNYKECHDTIRHVLSSDQYRCLILVDGLDEWRISKDKSSELTHNGLPNIETFSACTCFFTLRPSRLDVVASAIYDSKKVVQIFGLNEKGQNLVVDKVLKLNYGLTPGSEKMQEASSYIHQKVKKLKVSTILQIPLLATTSVMLWYEKEEVGNSLTSFYLALIQLLIRRAINPQDFDFENLKSKHKQFQHNLNVLDIPRYRTLKDFAGVLCLLGEIAYNNLMSDKESLVFDKGDLQDRLGRDTLVFAFKVGLLCQYEAPGCFDEENVSVHFFHNSVQELLAALYVAMTREFQLLCGKVSDVKSILEMSDLLIFSSGLSSVFASEISEHIVRITNNNSEIRLARETFLPKHVKKLQSLYLLQVRCYQEMKHCETFCNGSSRAIAFHVGDVCLPYTYDNLDIIEETVEIMTYHYGSTVSLYFVNVPGVGSNCITDEVLNEFLGNATSLQYLLIYGHVQRAINQINDTICLKSLHLSSVRLSDAAVLGIFKSIESQKELRALTLLSVQYIEQDDEGMEINISLNDLIDVLPQCSQLYMLSINHPTLYLNNRNIRRTFLSVLPRLQNLRRLIYDRFFPLFNQLDLRYDAAIIEILSKVPSLEYLYLYNIRIFPCDMQRINLLLETPSLRYLRLDHIHFGNTPIEIHSLLSKLSKIFINCLVHLSDESWDIYVSYVERYYNNNYDINTEDSCDYEMSRDSSNFLVTVNLDTQSWHFTRLLREDDDSV